MLPAPSEGEPEEGGLAEAELDADVAVPMGMDGRVLAGGGGDGVAPADTGGVTGLAVGVTGVLLGLGWPPPLVVGPATGVVPGRACG